MPGAETWERRPAWLEMVTHLNGVRTVIIERLDRLARVLFVQEHILRDLKARNVVLVSATEPDLDSDPTRTLFRQMLGAIAQYDKAMIVLKLRGARDRVKAANGRCEGRKPYGHYHGEAHVVERMRQLRASGLSFDRIAAQLNQEQIKPRTGKRWWGRTVNNVLVRGRTA